MAVDPLKVRPIGAWVLIKVDPPPKKQGSLYLPMGNLPERLGQATGTILRIGPGEWTLKHNRRKPHGLKPGDRVMFRGYLQEVNQPGGFMDREHCLIHVRDINLVVEDDSVEETP
jgi:co-chaperonin GroES (HSP10)